MKKNKVFLLLSSVVGLVLFLIVFSLNHKPDHLISDCSIYSSTGTLLKKYADGVSCLFLEDGSLVAHDENSLKRLDPIGNIMWQHKGEYHHQLTLLKNKKTFIALANADDDHLNREIRHGQIELWSIDGQRLKTWTVKNQVDYFFHFIQQPPLKTKPFDGPYAFEYEHINAAYELPKNSLEIKDPAFKEGHILVSINYRSSLVIFSADTLRPLKLIPLPKTITNFHDAQMLPSGEIILYINAESAKDPRLLIKINPLTMAETTVLTHHQAGSDQPEIFGGVQVLKNDRFLLNIQKNKAWSVVTYSQNEGIVAIKSSESSFGFTQQIKFENVSQFLKKNKSL